MIDTIHKLVAPRTRPGWTVAAELAHYEGTYIYHQTGDAGKYIKYSPDGEIVFGRFTGGQPDILKAIFMPAECLVLTSALVRTIMAKIKKYVEN